VPDVPDIDHYSPVPLYVQLANLLRDRIATGAIEAGRPLPSQRTLIEEYGLARGTVARAFKILSDEGLVVTVPGKGIYVRPRK
jgi:DNA-binding GntR family transcriptional regulator